MSRIRKRPVVLAIGIFDGVHLGHRAILKKAVREAGHLRAEAAALTFPSHPSRVLHPDRPVPLMQTFEQRCRAIRSCGIKKIFALHFSRRLSKLGPVEFVDRVLFRHWNLRGVVVGRNFRFGHGRCGDVEDLRRLLAPRAASVWGVGPVRSGGRTIQSTVIRRKLVSGRPDDARRMLGRAVVLTGVVRKGAGMGVKLGARTVNLKLRNELLPKFGVYAGWIGASKVASSPSRRPFRPVVINLGIAPTVHRGREVLLEAHVLDGRRVSFKPGAVLNVEMDRFLRSERKFSTVRALGRAIQKDVRRARQILRRGRSV